MKLLFRPLSLLLAGVLGSCMVPLDTPDSGSRAASNAETRLVFHTVAGNRAFADQLAASNYLTLELRLLSDSSNRSFAAATKDGNGDFIVTIPGLVAGDWRIRAYFYDTEASADLLLYARQSVYLAPGQVRDDIVLALYAPGAPGSMNPTTTLEAHHIVLDPQGALYDQPANPPRVVGTGSKTKLLATVFSDVVSTTPPPANPADVQPDEYDQAGEQGLVWTSSDPYVAVVSSSGLVTALHPGRAAITAASVENQTVTKRYHFEVIPGIEGSWLSPKSDGYGSNMLFRFHQGQWILLEWDTYFNAAYPNVEPSSYGRRGSYSLNGDSITFVTEGWLLPGSVEWVPVTEGTPDSATFVYRFALEGDSLAFVQESSGPRGDAISSGLDLGFLGTRVDEVALQTNHVGLTSWSLTGGVGSTTLSEGDGIDLSSTFSTATVRQLVWVSSDETKVRFRLDADTYDTNVGALSTGTVTLKAYALDALDYPGTFAANGPPPVITLTLTIESAPL